MTLDDLRLRHSALLAARYSGTRSISYDGKTVIAPSAWLSVPSEF
jgi:hypothetical protein